MGEYEQVVLSGLKSSVGQSKISDILGVLKMEKSPEEIKWLKKSL
jgi:hypothetical protein